MKQVKDHSSDAVVLASLAVAYIITAFVCNLNTNAQPIILFGWLAVYLADITIPAIFILKDAIQKRFGRSTTLKVVALNVVVNVAIYLWSTLANITAPDALYGYISGSFVLFVGSMLSFAVAESVDAIVYSRIGGSHVKKSLVSNLISAPIDTIIVSCSMALVGIPLSVIATSVCVQLTMKIGTPALYGLACKLHSMVKRKEDNNATKA